MKKKDLWFKGKKYGWGWYPVTWQGWVVTVGFVIYEFALSAFIGKAFEERAGVTSFIFLTFLGTLVLIVICCKKGEPPKWRWGK